MVSLTKDLWHKFRGRLLLLLALMAIAGAIEGVGLLLFLPFVSLLSSGAISTNMSGFLTNFIFQALGPNYLLWKLAALITVIFACQAAISIMQGKMVAELESDYVGIWRHNLLTAMLNAKWSYFLEHKAGQLLFTFGTETERLGRAFFLLAQIASSAILLAIYFSIAIYISWAFSLLLVVIGALGFVLITKRFARKAYNTGKSYATHNSRLLGYVSEFLSAAKMIKATSSEERVLAICTNLFSILKRNYASVIYYPYVLRSILEFFIIMGICTSLLFLHFVGISFVSMLILMAICMRILPKMHIAQSSYQILLGYLPGFNVVTEQLKTANLAAENDLMLIHSDIEFSKPVSIRFENVSKRYEQLCALNRTNFTVKAGSICAVVGPSGAGKSTLVDLIVKIVQPSQGEIFINNIPLVEISNVKWRRSIGYVTQESVLLHDTILNNIVWGAIEYSEADVLRASRLANAHDFIMSLPAGYETVVGERGSKLSGGQRQRIALARALISRPRLLILDEATSALDAESEHAIVETLRQLRGELTILLISHRLSPVRIADQIIVLDDGHIAESGTWEELLNGSGRFMDLWSSQQLAFQSVQ